MSFVVLEPQVSRLYAVTVPARVTMYLQATGEKAVARYMRYLNDNYPDLLATLDTDSGHTFYHGSVVRRQRGEDSDGAITVVPQVPRELRRTTASVARPASSRFATLDVCPTCNGLIPEECQCASSRRTNRPTVPPVRRFSSGMSTTEIMIDRGDV